MDRTRSQRILANAGTAGAFLVCLAIAAGFGGVRPAVLPEPSSAAAPTTWPSNAWTSNAWTASTSTTKTWTTSSEAVREVELSAGPAAVESPAAATPIANAAAAPNMAVAPASTAPAEVRAAPVGTAAAAEPDALPAVADLPPPIVVDNVGRTVFHVAGTPTVESDANVVGLWAPDAASCSMRSFRQGLLPTIINTEGAWAGETFCMFKNRKPTENGWRVVAECLSGADHWTTPVRLSLKGERLIWESKNGRQVYTRCGDDLRMAAAR